MKNLSHEHTRAIFATGIRYDGPEHHRRCPTATTASRAPSKADSQATTAKSARPSTQTGRIHLTAATSTAPAALLYTFPDSFASREFHPARAWTTDRQMPDLISL